MSRHNLELYRYSTRHDSTLGLLYFDGQFLCYVLEDGPRKVKVRGETRIPKGEYRVKLRTIGGHHERYARSYGLNHHGMLQIINVPGFEFILIHVGNYVKDTAGCLLVGESPSMASAEFQSLVGSRHAYERIYPIITAPLLRGEGVFITILDKE
jgi:hypothetical protein